MAIHAKVTSKGQVTLPKALRDALGIKAGDRVVFKRDGNGHFGVAVEAAVKSKSFIDYDGPKLSPDDIVELVHRAREGTGAEFLAEIRIERSK